jgi:L,D-peptidoglycan transpeptidase YkuD (ErfK/YbiS/YcfS/YnhG family)
MHPMVNCAEKRLFLEKAAFQCAIGRNGCLPATEKTEGDGATPLGRWPLRRVYYRADRIDPPQTALPICALSRNDGWCDAPEDPRYNQHVRLPYPASHERLWRDEHVYDIIVELGHNDDPVVPARGSAVFIHIAKPDFSPTAGCIALRLDDLRAILVDMTPGSHIDIRAS